MRKINQSKVKIVEEYFKTHLSLYQYIQERNIGKISGERMQCPFHEDATPSMFVSEEKSIFKCFSCGKGGGVISFHQHYMNIVNNKKFNYYVAMDDLLDQHKKIKFELGIPTVFDDDTEERDYTKKIEVRKRFSLKDRNEYTTPTVKQTVTKLKERNDIEEIMSFMNDCMNEFEESALVRKYHNKSSNTTELNTKGLTLEDLMGR